ncbi:MAG: DUF4215 domain-containing protein [Nanoarchaeota archaeon]
MVCLRLKFGVARLGILFLLIVLSFVMIGCVPREPVFIEASADGRCTTISLPGLSRSGNGICQREGGDFTVCSAERPPQCTGISQIWNIGQCSREQDCTKLFKGVDVVVTCCLPEGAPSLIGECKEKTIPSQGVHSPKWLCENVQNEDGFTICDNSYDIRCELGGLSELEKAARGRECFDPKCNTEITSGVDVTVRCCRPPGEPAIEAPEPEEPGSGGAGVTTICRSSDLGFNPNLEFIDTNWACCVGERYQGQNGGWCCDGTLKNKLEINSDLIENDFLGDAIYTYNEDQNGAIYIALSGRDPFGEYRPYPGITTENANEYTFSGLDENNQLVSVTRKLLYCESQCKIFIGNEVEDAIESGECEGGAAGSILGEPPEGCRIYDFSQDLGIRSYVENGRTGIAACGLSNSAITTGDRLNHTVCRKAEIKYGDKVAEVECGDNIFDRVDPPDAIYSFRAICCSPPEVSYINCQEEYGEEFACYTNEEWVNAGSPEPIHEVAPGCDTGSESFGYCAPLVETGEFIRSHGSDPDRCEFAELKWLTPSGKETEGTFGSGVGQRQGGTGSQQPGQEVILFALMDLDCSEDNDIKFDLKEVRGRGPYHLEYINADFIFKDGVVWAKKTLEWTNWELVFQSVQNPQFRFNLVSDGRPSQLSDILTVLRPTEECGDGRIDPVEEACDDGNTASGDGCSASCQKEEGWICNGGPSICSENCGDGKIVGGERCDDRNKGNGDGCNADCRIESGWSCSGEPSVCQKCGNGIREGNEVCDDGNTAPGDGCYGCAIEDGWSCIGDLGEQSVCTENLEPCHIFNARWRSSSGAILNDGAHVIGTATEDGYVDGAQVYLSVEGDESCRGRTAKFTIYEDDSGGETSEDIANIIDGVRFFVGDTIIIAFEEYFPVWFDENLPPWEGDDDPEYYFVVETAITNDEPLISGKINVDRPRATQCNDGSDNDADGLRDLDDPGCWDENGEYDINDDNEGDRNPQCQDGDDNDDDGLKDWPADPGCCDDPRYGRCDHRDNSEGSA